MRKSSNSNFTHPARSFFSDLLLVLVNSAAKLDFALLGFFFFLGGLSVKINEDVALAGPDMSVCVECRSDPGKTSRVEPVMGPEISYPCSGRMGSKTSTIK